MIASRGECDVVGDQLSEGIPGQKAAERASRENCVCADLHESAPVSVVSVAVHPPWDVIRSPGTPYSINADSYVKDLFDFDR